MEDDKKKKTSRRNEPLEKSPFKDVNVEDADYQYIKQGLEKVSSQEFLVICLNLLTHLQGHRRLPYSWALGFANRAPNPVTILPFLMMQESPFGPKIVYMHGRKSVSFKVINNRAI